MGYTTLPINIEKLKILLVKENLSLDQLAVKMGVARETVYRLFKNERATIKTLNKLINALQIEVEEVL